MSECSMPSNSLARQMTNVYGNRWFDVMTTLRSKVEGCFAAALIQRAFDTVFRCEGLDGIPTPYRAPNANAFNVLGGIIHDYYHDAA